MASIASSEIHPVDQVPPAGRLIILGLQHVLIMYAGAVAVPLIVGRALKLTPEQIVYLIDADLLACGLVTLVQSYGLGPIGIRLPLMMGATFTAVAPMLALVASEQAAGTAPERILQIIYGSVIAAGFYAMLAAPVGSRLLRFFPPVVTGSIILVIGITLMPVSIDWAAGAASPDMPGYGAPLHLAIAFLVLLTILGVSRFARGFLAHVAVLLGIAAGAGVAAALGLMSLAKVESAPAFALVEPFHFGWPVFAPIPALTMCLVLTVTMIESTGGFLAVGEMTGRPLEREALVRGLRADGLGAIIGGVFNTFPYTTFSQNVGLVGMTGVRSRFVCVAGGVILLLLSLVPKLAALVESLPVFVLGGAGLVMFGMVAATGIKALAKVDFDGARHNLLIVAVSVGLGMIPLVSSRFFQALPASLSPLLGSGILLATLAAVLLNLLFNGPGSSQRERA